MNIKKRFGSFLLFTAFILLSSVIFVTAAEEKAATEKLIDRESGLIIISHMGDGGFFSENTLEAVQSAFNKGADFVSVELQNTGEGYFISDGTSLEKLIACVPSSKGLIIDISFEERDGVYNTLLNCNGLEKAVLRMQAKNSDIISWADGLSEKANVIGIYSGNIIFSIISHINAHTKSESAAVQYQSKNYFNVAFGEFFAGRYLTQDNVRAVVATYDKDLCGQRSDGTEGWDELILKGYSVIETNNTAALFAYREETENVKADIKALLEKSKAQSYEAYSQACINNIEKAQQSCEKVLANFTPSLNEACEAYSSLVFALGHLEASDSKAQLKGELNITAGKVIISLLVGAIILTGQIYVYKMRKVKKS